MIGRACRFARWCCFRGWTEATSCSVRCGRRRRPASIRSLSAIRPAHATTTSICYPPFARSFRRPPVFPARTASFSGPLVLLAAAERPPGLRGVILAASFVKTPVPWLPRWARHLVTPGVFRFYPAASRAKALLGGYGSREVRRLLREAHAFAGREALACRARGHAFDRRDRRPRRLSGARALPARAQGRRDPASRAVEIRRLARRWRSSTSTVRTFALVTNPAPAWAALSGSVDRVDAGG